MKRSFLSIPLACNGLWNAAHAFGLRPYASERYCALPLCRLSAKAKFHIGAPSTMRPAWWKRTASSWILFQTAVSRPGTISSERVTHQTGSIFMLSVVKILSSRIVINLAGTRRW
jgi:hypothetical protein